MKLFLFLIFCITSFTFVVNVPENWTKKCDQSSFCRRCRNIESNKNIFEVQNNTLNPNETWLTVEIINANKPDNVFLLKLECMESNTFHFEIDQKNPVPKRRFRLTDEVIDAETTRKNIVVEKNGTLISAKCDKNLAIIHVNPFKIDFYQDGVLTVTANGKGLMTFEHLLMKPDPLVENDEDPDAWEETYMGVTDSKPNGPEAIALDFTFHSSEILFGIPEHHDTFALRRTSYGEPYRLYTVDMTIFEVDSRMPNYGAVPVIYGHAVDRTSGIFWHNAADTYVDIHDTQTAHFITEAGIIDVYVFLGPSPNDAFSQYTKITGVGNLPQLFTLGFHQCRWSYLSAKEVIDIVKNFDENDFPLDTMWLDIDYTDGYRYFTWNKENFSDPVGFLKDLESTGRRLVHIVDPHIKADEEYFFFKEARDQGFLVKLADSKTDYYGRCWPGNSSYLDYFNPQARKYYADQYAGHNFSARAGIWNDMNEPAVFDVPEKTFPRDNVHTNGNITIEHRSIHNIYGLLQTKATFDGMLRRSNEYRPYILTRSFFAGTQKYSSVWTGDNSADWPYLKASIQACLAISVSGISFCGSDIGGFFGNPDDDLFVRWTQAAAFQPFFRNHASWGTKNREPYVWEEKTRNLTRNAMRRRYQLLPFWYTLFYEHEMTGYPIMRPMLANYPKDRNGFTIDTQYMLSDKLLVRPVLDPQTTSVIVRFPSIDGKDEGEFWYDIYDSYKKYDIVGSQAIDADEDKVPVFQRGGTIIPAKMKPQKSSVYMRDDPLTLYVAVDKNLKASGNVYIDDETSFKYRDGVYKMVNFEFNNRTLNVTENENNEFKPKIERIYFAGLNYSDEISSAIVSCSSENSATFVLSKITQDYFYVDVSQEFPSCDMEWTLEFINSGSTMSKTLVMSVIIFNVIKRILF